MVLLDGQPTLACQTTVAAVAGRAITTIEGIAATAHDGTIMLHPVQQAFLDAQASQCGWCLGAQVLSTIALLNDNPTPSETAINQAMDRVYCRCAVYGRIRVAIRRAAESASGSSAGGAAV
jgi:isoquinoline 1-oxidoreductase alpha subunit